MSIQTHRLAAIYLRVSLDATGEHLSVDRHREDCLKLAAQRGWSVVGEYVDHSITASKREVQRPGYNAMVADYAAGKFDAILCYDLDRLTRQPRQLEDWIDAAEQQGLIVVTTNGEADLGTDGGRMYARIKAAVARQEIERKGERQRGAAAQRAAKGRPPLGVRLTGYSPKGDLVPDEAAMVRAIFKKFVGGESLRGIARWLTTNGHTTRHGNAWSPSSIRTILLNPRYAGHAIYQGQVLAHNGGWTPLVSKETFALVQHRLTDPRRVSNRSGTDRKHLGSGLYLCRCGRKMRGWSGNRYRCAAGCYARSGDPVDAMVEEEILRRLSRADLSKLLVSNAKTGRAAALLAETERLGDRLRIIENDYDAGLIDGLRYRTASDKVLADIKAADGERMRLLSGTGPASVLGAPDPALAFRKASLMVKQATIDFLAEITLLPGQQGSKTFQTESVVVAWKHASDDSGSSRPARNKFVDRPNRSERALADKG